MRKTKTKYALQANDGTYYAPRNRFWESGSLAMAEAMTVIAEKQNKKSYRVVARHKI